MIVILDSNIWLAELGLRSPLGAVARLYLQQKRARLALPEVIRLEVEHNLRNQLRNYVRALQTTHRQLLTVFGTLKELVVPDAVAIEGRVAQLFAKLGVEVLEIPFSLASARSSFLKTIDKVPTPHRIEMTNAKKGTKTTLEASDVRYNRGLGDEVFTERTLERGKVD